MHAGVDIARNQREKLERLCRYVSRPPVASERLALTASGQVRYTLKTPYRDGTTHIVLEPLDLMARLAALVPRPRMHLTRYHGVLAPHSQYRGAVTPAHRGRGAPKPPVSGAEAAKPSPPRHVGMSWARGLKRVFGVQIESCAGQHHDPGEVRNDVGDGRRAHRRGGLLLGVGLRALGYGRVSDLEGLAEGYRDLRERKSIFRHNWISITTCGWIRWYHISP